MAALLLWPLSYAWIPLAQRSPPWILVLVASDARWGIGLGALALTLVIGGNVLAIAILG
jgi:hypothetical protein